MAGNDGVGIKCRRMRILWRDRHVPAWKLAAAHHLACADGPPTLTLAAPALFCSV